MKKTENYITKNIIATPLIFKKKVNKSLIKPLQYINSDTGKMKHYPPAAQEWYNSIYTYNKNYTKSLPILDKNLMILLKNFSNMLPSKYAKKDVRLVIKRKNLKGEKKRLFLQKLKTKPIVNYKRLSSRKVFVGKGDLKHTSSKVIITLYTYNVLKMYLVRKIKRLIHLLYFPKKRLVMYITTDMYGNKLISYNRPLSLKEYLYSPEQHKIITTSKRRNVKYLVTFYEAYLSFIISNVKKMTKHLSIIIKYFEFLTALVTDKILNENEKFIIFTKKTNKFNVSKYNKRFFVSTFKAEKLYLARLIKFAWALYINNIKFKEPVMVSKLKWMVRNLYNKEVEFNVVELKKMHLSSDIFTQAVALKLKNRNNKLFRVLTSSLSKIDLPNVSRITERHNEFDKEEYLVNKIRNTYINSMVDKNINNDPLNKLLLGFFPSGDLLEEITKKRSSPLIKSSISINDFVIKNLKHLNLAGVRVEAKGRLTRRFTAQRSVFKMKYKGGLKNVDSSFKGLPAVMLRGIAKSNVQYSLVNSKNRNGAYGVKGWIGNK